MSEQQASSGMVYIVTRGAYSDYRIEAVFDDETAANDYCERRNQSLTQRSIYDEFHVEPYELNTVSTRDRSGRWWYEVFFEGEEITYVYLDEYIDDTPEPMVSRTHDGRLVFYVEAATPEQAEKIAQDKRAEYLADQAGIR